MSSPGEFFQIAATAPKNSKPVGAVAAAVRVLRYLSDVGQPVGVSQVAKGTDLYSSTCFNILRTLAQDDLVTFDENTKTYALGLGIIEFAQSILSKGGFMPAIQTAMIDVARKGGFSTTLWRRVPASHNVVILSVDSGRVVQIHIGIGQRLPTFIGATGRAIAAVESISEKELKAEFGRLRWDKPLTFTEYLKQVSEARERGWAIDDGYYRHGLVTIAVPIVDHTGTTRLIIAAHMFAGEFTDAQHHEIAARLQQIADRARHASSLNLFD